MKFEDFKNFAFFIYSIPAIVLYLILLYFIFVKKKPTFSGPFFHLFGFTSIFYVIHIIFYYIAFRFLKTPTLFPFFKTWKWEGHFYTINYTILYYTAHAMPLFNFAINFNRFTIFFLRDKYNRFWKTFLGYILLFCTFSPIAAVYSIPMNGFYGSFDENRGIIFMANGLNYDSLGNSAKILIFEIFITGVGSLFCNLYIVYQLVYHQKYDTAWKVSSRDKHLLFYSVFIFFTEICSCLQQIMLLLNNPDLSAFVSATQWIIADVSTLGPVIFLLATNSSLRNEMFQKFRKVQPVTVISIH